MRQAGHIVAAVEHTVAALIDACGGGRCRRAVEVQVAVGPFGQEGEEAWCVAAGDVHDPVLVLGHAGVDSRTLGLGAALAKAYDSALDPPVVVFGHQRAPRVSLWEAMDVGCGDRQRLSLRNQVVREMTTCSYLNVLDTHIQYINEMTFELPRMQFWIISCQQLFFQH